MLANLKHHGLQKVMNIVNQFNKITPEWGKSEELYSRIYLDHVVANLESNFPDGATLNVLDGGCGTGEMAIELAKQGHQVTGIEIHKPSLEKARSQASEAGVSVTWISGDLYDSLKKMPTGEFDVVLCFGVLYTCAQYEEIIGEFGRAFTIRRVSICKFSQQVLFRHVTVAKKTVRESVVYRFSY